MLAVLAFDAGGDIFYLEEEKTKNQKTTKTIADAISVLL